MSLIHCLNSVQTLNTHKIVQFAFDDVKNVRTAVGLFLANFFYTIWLKVNKNYAI